jgi:hypothetical protein
VSGDGQLQLQKAVYAALEPAVSPAKVYDHVPQNKGFPYVVIGDGEAREWDTTTELGQEHRVDIHVFSRDAKGKRAVKELQRKIYDALHDQDLVLEAGAALVLLLLDFSTVVLDPDGETYHGVSQFRAITTEA